MDVSLVVRRETQVAAPLATVFAFLTDPQKILSWMGAEADTDAHPGGLYLVKDIAGRPGRTARGEFREVVPVHRLAYSFGWDDDANVPPGSSLVEIDLLERNGGTLVRMTHTGLPNTAECEGHAKGWAYYSHNAFFWAKMAGFAAIGLLSVPPTMEFIRWRKLAAAPDDAAVKSARRYLHAELGLFVLLLVFAAAMARGYGEF